MPVMQKRKVGFFRWRRTIAGLAVVRSNSQLERLSVCVEKHWEADETSVLKGRILMVVILKAATPPPAGGEMIHCTDRQRLV